MQPPQREPGWAEIFVPLHAIDPEGIQLGEPKKSVAPGIPTYAQDRPIAHTSYTTDLYSMPILGILTPFLRVYNWDSTIGRLDLELDATAKKEVQTIQETLIRNLRSHPQWLRSQGTSVDELTTAFQPMLNGSIMSLYLHGPNQDTKPVGRVWIWNQGWLKGATASSFRKGQSLRVALRIQGLCFLQTPAGKTRFRVQHQTVAVFQTGKP